MSKLRCPACGKGIRVDSADAGGVAMCRACGTRVDVPIPPLLPPVFAAPNEGTEAATGFVLPPPAEQVLPVPPLAGEPVSTSDASAASECAGGTPAAEGNGDALPAQAAEPDGTISFAPPPAAERPVLRVAVTDGPDREEDLVPLLLDRSAAEPIWSGRAMPSMTVAPMSASPGDPFPVAPIQVVAPATADADTVDEAPDSSRAIGAREGAGLNQIIVHRTGGHPVWWGLLGVLGSVVVVLFVLVATKQVDWFEPWEASAAPQVQRLKSEAEAMAARGAFRESHERYRKIDEQIAGREIRDPALRKTVADARDDARRVYALVLQRAAAESRAAEEARRAEAMSARPILPPAVVGPPVVAPQPIAPPVIRVDPPPKPVEAPKPAPKAEEPKPAEPRPAPPRRGERPVPRPAPAVRGVLTDERIGESIQLGVDYLLKQFNDRTSTLPDRDRGDNSYSAGMNALAVYALLQAGQAIEDPRLSANGERMRRLVKAMKALPIDGHHQTYARGLRATCLALFNHPEDFKTLWEDADWLIGTTNAGAYTYNGVYRKITQRGNFNNQGAWDNSNSQYGLLGVWSAIDAEPRIEVPAAYWRAVEDHWTTVQQKDGQWSYHEGGAGRLSMTSAGIASLFVTHEYLEPPMTTGTVGRDPFPPALKKGLEWFERDNNALRVRDGNWWGYILYGIERVGLASGFKHFGPHDWYRELSQDVVAKQQRNGSWGDGVVDTSYAILFLSRGRHPVMMNKLRFDGGGEGQGGKPGFWSNRPRDVANLARFTTRQMERPINWQVVNANNPWTDWSDSPIVYIASHVAPELTDDHVSKLRRFVEAGGMIVTHADAGSPAFDQWARQLAARLFPLHEMAPVPDNHALWTTAYKITSRPPLMGVNNGSRLLMVHSPTDVALKWQQRVDRIFEGKDVDPNKNAADPAVKARILAPFHLGVNLFLYAAGKRDLRNRLDSAWVQAPTARPLDTVRVARLRYAGNWDPEPGAWERYANWFQWQTSVRLEVSPVKLADLSAAMAKVVPIAHLTGTARATFSDAEVAGLRAYVEGGGLVLIDSTGGMNGFDGVVRETLLPKAFPNRHPSLVEFPHALMSAGEPGMEELKKTRVRSYTFERLGAGVGAVQLLTPEKGADASTPGGAVLLTSLDVTSGLLGINTWGILGFDPKYAQSLVKNAIFWAQDGMVGR